MGCSKTFVIRTVLKCTLDIHVLYIVKLFGNSRRLLLMHLLLKDIQKSRFGFNSSWCSLAFWNYPGLWKRQWEQERNWKACYKFVNTKNKTHVRVESGARNIWLISRVLTWMAVTRLSHSKFCDETLCRQKYTNYHWFVFQKVNWVSYCVCKYFVFYVYGVFVCVHSLCVK
jgi:hypothetical protein